jgi:ribosomal protein S27AE
MRGSGRIVGIILIFFGLAAIGIAGVWALAEMASDNSSLTLGGAAVGVALVFFLVTAPTVGVGAYLLVKGRRESAELAEVDRQRKLLNIVLSRGQVNMSDLVLELGATTDQVKAWIYDLVGKGLFSGYINWNDGILYSKQAGSIRETKKCPNCGGQMQFGGKGVITCPYCGTDVFLAT